MNTPHLVIAGIALAAFAATGNADYLFTFQDTTGDIVGFSEPTLQPSGDITSFLFNNNNASALIFNGTPPASCGGLGSLTFGCAELELPTLLAGAGFPAGSFESTGTFTGRNGSTAQIVQYSGYLFTYEDTFGNIVAFSEPSLEASGTPAQFLFSTPGITNFSFSSSTGACGPVGSPTPSFACAEAFTPRTLYSSIFPLGSFESTGTFTGSEATVNIVAATAAPEPATEALFPLGLIAAGLIARRRRRGRV